MSLADKQFTPFALALWTDDASDRSVHESPFLRFGYARLQTRVPAVVFAANVPLDAPAPALRGLRLRPQDAPHGRPQDWTSPHTVEAQPVACPTDVLSRLQSPMLLRKHRTPVAVAAVARHARLLMPATFLRSRDGSFDLASEESDSDSDSDNATDSVPRGLTKTKSQSKAKGKAKSKGKGDDIVTLEFPTKTDRLPKVAEDRRGVKRWVEEYWADRPDIAALQKEIEAVVSEYDQREKKTIEKRQQEKLPDEDGWTTVHHGKKAKAAPRKMTKTLKKERLLEDFYAFQRREKKVQRLTELRRKFEEDKERIARMKANRKFKPY
eukprot:TRINITY_DN6400_c1_g2_i1.p1 TRINITY_DN6400_c1_g2~~TRINITY_DN6400_c1_g2_i1.p1  ORF type:complete len:324 (+),score=57.22 TRINITY_DN6400_c1_g2_i1:54-1025(+)